MRKRMTTVTHQQQRAEWHHLDARGKVLGRLATRVATLLLGKHHADFTPHRIAPVYVVVTNSNHVLLTGKKETHKVYRRYSGYSGGIHERTAASQRSRDSRRLIIEAVAGMLPKNSLRRGRLRHLKVYPADTHLHHAQLKRAVPEQSN